MQGKKRRVSLYEIYHGAGWLASKVRVDAAFFFEYKLALAGTTATSILKR